MLSPYRVIDLTDDRGNVAGLLLAQMGADVIAVEPPTGQRARRLAPFAQDLPDPEGSLTHWAYNRGKRSVVLDDPAQLVDLVAEADIVVENGAYPVDLVALRAADPALITATITPYGETGPKADWSATDLTVVAASGTMSIVGDNDRPPVRVSTPQTWHFAALDALCGSLLALTERSRSGRGQHVSAAAQSAYVSASQYMMTYPLAGQEPTSRVAGGIQIGPLTLQIVNPCRDGFVAAAFLFGPIFGPYTIRLFEWMYSEGMAPKEYTELDWIGMGLALTTDPAALEYFRTGSELLATFLLTRTKKELTTEALARRLLIAPVSTTRDLLESEHLAERGYWDRIDGHRYNGRIAVVSDTPLRSLGSAPRLGEHTDQVRSETPERQPLPDPINTGTINTGPIDTGAPPLDGVHILDFSWAIAAPEATRLLADFGATVIRIESDTKPDVLRGAGPFLGEAGGLENSISWHSPNAGKLSMAVDLRAPEVRELVADLVRWADVVVDSFSVGVMDDLGLGPTEIRTLNPELIVVSSTLPGRSGPLSSLSGFGTTGAAVAGFYPTTGWPDRPPAGPFGAYTDYSSPRFTAALILAALDHRRRTGTGQHIDYSQMEGAMHLLTPLILDDEVNGREGGRMGNHDLNMAPHGVYPVKGEDRWIAIACETDDQWKTLTTLLSQGHDGLSEEDGDQRGLDVLGLADRLARRDELDQLLAAWTEGQDGAELETRLQAAGVPAHQVLFAPDVLVEPQLNHRDFFTQVDHPIHPHSWAERRGFDLDRTPARVTHAGPTMGQHVWEVLTEHLGYDADTAADWLATGHLH